MHEEKGIRIPIYRATGLKVRTLKTSKPRPVKGGPINWPNGLRKGGLSGELLPAVQRALR